MKKITFLLFLMLTCFSVSYGQIPGYTFSQSAGTYSPITGGTVLGTPINDDQSFNAVNIGFTFNYNEINFTQVSVNSNGFLALGATVTSSYTSLSSGGTNNVLAVLNGDLEGNAVTGELSYLTTGTAPNRVFTVQWKSYGHYGDLGLGDENNFQIQLFETTNVINFNYGAFTQNATARTRQVGIRGASNAVFRNRTTATDWSATTAGALNTANCALTTAIFPASGLTFTWTPPPVCSVAPVGGTATPALLALCPGSLPGNIVATGFTNNVGSIALQWEQSPDGTAWSNVVGGTGATTATYTPPAFTGTTIQYRLKVTCTPSGLTGFSTVSVFNPPGNPSTQVSNVNIVGVATSAAITWTNGNGNRRVVVFNTTNTFTNPLNGNGPALTAAAAYAGSGQQIVYDGTAAAVTVTGLVTNTAYFVKVYEYLRCGTGPYDFYYNTSTGTNVDAVEFLDYANLQFPGSATLDTANPTVTVYGQVYEGGLTDVVPNIAGQAPGIEAWVGISPIASNTNPNTWTNWTLAVHNTGSVGNNDEYQATIGNTVPGGVYYYATRYRLNNGTYSYGGIDSGGNGGFWNGTNYNSGVLTINSPAYDDCPNAVSLTVGVDFAANANLTSNVGATASQIATPSIPAPTCSLYSGGDIWHKVVVPASGNITIETSNAVGSPILDTGMVVYSGVCGTLVTVECDDDDSINGNFSIVNLTGRTPGETLYIRTFEYGNNLFGNYQVSAYNCPSQTPAPTGSTSQSFCNAATVANLVATGTAVKWYATATGGTELVPTTALVNGSIYYASQTLTCESFNRLAVTVTINPLPVVTNSTLTTCDDNTDGFAVFNLTSSNASVSSEAGATFSHYLTLVDAQNETNALTNATAFTNTTNPQTVYVRVENANGCFSTANLVLNVTTTLAPTGNATQTYCNGTVASLQATGTTIQWYATLTGGSPLASSTLLTDATIYYASQTANGCESGSRFAVTVTVLCYCIPTYTFGTEFGDLISNVAILTTPLANNSGTDVTGPVYTYYTGQPNYTATLQAGSSYTVSVSVGSFGNQNVAVWIDYNDNFVFEASEKVGFTTASINGAGTATFTISLSCSPPLGLHRMRVRDVYATSGNTIDPCSNYGFGETEDYDVTISAAVACPQPSALAVNTVTSTSANLTWNTGCVETLWDLHLTTVGGGAPTGAPSNPNVSSPFAATSLSPLTSYEFYVRADCQANGTSLWTGPFVFTTNPVPPANDECTGAYSVAVNPDLACDTVTAGTVVGATASSTDATACFGEEDDDVWFSFVATQTAHRISLTNVVGSTTDLFHSVWTGACGSLTLSPNSCSDNNNSSPSGLVVGQTYYIRVNTYTATPNQNTTFNVCVGTLPPPPANDDCTGAIALTAGGVFADNPVVGTNNSATNSNAPAPGCAGFSGGDVWYSVVVPSSGNITLETGTGSILDTGLAVYSGTCGTLSLVDCDDDDSTNGAYSIISLTGRTPGEILYVTVWDFLGNDEGTFQVSAYDASLGSANFDNSNFAYYPNPVKDVLNLSYSSNITKVQIINLLGQEVVTKSINSTESQLDMSNLPSGTYLVKVTADNLVKTIKVIKE